MINKLQKYLLMPLLIACFVLNSGCGILHPPHKDAQGFYTAHYDSCGPIAVQEALTRYCQVNGIKFKRAITTKELSQHIQKNGPPFIFNRTKLLIIFERDAAGITWPSEIKKACQLYGVKLTKVHKSQLWLKDNPNATYIVLVHKKWSLEYHWFAYPGNIAHVYGDDTIFDVVYLLEPIE